MADEYKNHIENLISMNKQSNLFTNEEFNNLKTHIKDLRETNMKIQVDVEEKGQLLKNYKARNKHLLDKMNNQNEEKNVNKRFLLNKKKNKSLFNSKSNISRNNSPNQSILISKDNYNRLKDKKDRLSFMCRLGMILNYNYFYGIQTYFDEIIINSTQDVDKVMELIVKAERQLYNDVTHLSDLNKIKKNV